MNEDETKDTYDASEERGAYDGSDTVSHDAPDRLRVSGVGVIFGGISLVVLSLLLTYTAAAGAVTAVGVAGWYSARRGGVPTGVGVGVAVVGTIGLVEAAGLGIGLEPTALGGIAVVFGVFDIVAGELLGRLGTR